MANQVIVTDSGNVQVAVSPPADVQVQISRAVIGTVANVASANYANFAGQVTNSNQPNITNVGTLGNLIVSNTITTTNLTVTGNLSAGNLVANSANYANFAGVAYSVAGANVSGIVGNATHANFADVANSVSGANVSGSVANATYANTAAVAYSVSGANVSGDVANANHANIADAANVAYSVSLANVSGAGNIASINLDGNSSNLLNGTGNWVAIPTDVANANYANYAGNAYSVDGANVSGEVANAAYANVSGIAYSVDGANVSGEVANAAYANISGIAYSIDGANVSGEVANAAYANISGIAYSVDGANVSGEVANANYAAYAGNVTIADQPNITSVGNLPYLQVSNSANTTGVVTQLSAGNIAIATNFSNVATYQLTTLFHPNASTAYPAERVIRSRGNVTTPTTAVSGDRMYQKAIYAYNGNTNVFAASETFTLVGTVNANANAAWTGGQWNVLAANPAGDIGNATALSPQNSLAFSNSGSLSITPGTPANTSLGQSSSSLVVTNYGATTANLVQAGGMTFQRARGNRDSVQSVQAGDQVSRSLFYCYSNGAYRSSNVAQYNVTVDSSYVANDVVVPMSHNFTAVANVGGVATFRTTSLYANGLASFPGNIISSNANLGNLAVANYFSGDGSLLSNVSANVTPAGSNTEIQFNSSNVLGASANLTFDNSINVLTVAGNSTFPAKINSQVINMTGATGGAIATVIDNIVNCPDIGFYRYDNNAYVNNYSVYRSRGTPTSPVDVEPGDSLFQISGSAYSNSTAPYAPTSTYSTVVNTNDYAGNISVNTLYTAADIANSKFTIQYGLFTTSGDLEVAQYGTGNLTVNGDSNLGNLATANFFSGDGSLLTNINPANVTRSFGSFTSNVTQTNSNVGNAVYMTLNNDEGSNGVSIVSNSQITIAQTGLYNLQFSAQVEKTDSGTDQIEIWLEKNGTAVANSATQLILAGNSDKHVAAWNWLIDANTANAYFEIAWGSTDANVQIVAVDSANTLSGVAIPSLIVTVVPVGA